MALGLGAALGAPGASQHPQREEEEHSRVSQPGKDEQGCPRPGCTIGTHRVIHLQRKLDLTVKFLEFFFHCGLWSREGDTGPCVRAPAEPRALPRAQDLPWSLGSLPGRGLSSRTSEVEHSPGNVSGEDGLGCAKMGRECQGSDPGITAVLGKTLAQPH